MTTLRRRLTRTFDARSRKGVELGPYEITIERDLRVPMEDGVELLADLIRPVGDSIPDLPTVVIRGPYGRRGLVAGSGSARPRRASTSSSGSRTCIPMGVR